jgi:hypothetical protein
MVCSVVGHRVCSSLRNRNSRHKRRNHRLRGCRRLAGWTEAVHAQLDPMGRFITNKSFSPKCNDRVDLNGSPGGESAGGQGNEAKQDQDCRERSGVFGRNLEEQA